jgi:Zn-dependent peptidase ImmA (M78 family)
VNRLLDLCWSQSPPPVDLHEVAVAGGVLSIEEREMVPEAAMAIVSGGFRIYLQSNFINLPGTRKRRRFSLAHEISHTFFYESRGGIFTPVPKAPRGAKLEAACHHGARLLLIPHRCITTELRQLNRPVNAADVVNLARKFDVAIEPMLRRLGEIGAFKSAETAIVLVYLSNKQSASIEHAICPPWLQSLLPVPARKESLSSWLRALRGEPQAEIATIIEKGLERETIFGNMKVSPFYAGGSQVIFEFYIEAPKTAQAVD